MNANCSTSGSKKTFCFQFFIHLIFFYAICMQNDDTNNTTSDEETSSKRSVRFNEEPGGDGENQPTELNATDEDGKPKGEQLTDYVTHMSLKRHSSLFHNALRRKLKNFFIAPTFSRN